MGLFARTAGVVLGSLVFAAGVGGALALYLPAAADTRCLLGGVAMPAAWTGAFLWLWPAAASGRLGRFFACALLLWSAVVWGLLGPGTA